MRALVIPVSGWFGSSHPLATGASPKWASAWGDTRAYGPWAAPDDGEHRFLWYSPKMTNQQGFWFCPIEEPKSDMVAHILKSVEGVRWATLDEVALIQDNLGYKNRMAELANQAEQARRNTETEARLIEDMRQDALAHPNGGGKYPTLAEALAEAEKRFRKPE